jgi:hypothetical protein
MLVFFGTQMPWYVHSLSRVSAEKHPISLPNEEGHFGFENSTRSQYMYHFPSPSQCTMSNARTAYLSVGPTTPPALQLIFHVRNGGGGCGGDGAGDGAQGGILP